MSAKAPLVPLAPHTILAGVATIAATITRIHLSQRPTKGLASVRCPTDKLTLPCVVPLPTCTAAISPRAPLGHNGVWALLQFATLCLLQLRGTRQATTRRLCDVTFPILLSTATSPGATGPIRPRCDLAWQRRRAVLRLQHLALARCEQVPRRELGDAALAIMDSVLAAFAPCRPLAEDARLVC